MPTVTFHTLGCKVNHYETEAMIDLFKKRGYQIVDFEDKSDIYIINSCTVTNEAARKSRQFARRAKRTNPEGIVVMMGCYPQVSPEEIEEIEEIDYILGTGNKIDIVELLEKATGDKKYLDEIIDYQNLTEYEDLKVKQMRETTRGYVKIEEGCNQFCTYCIIPYARGTVRSRKMSSVIDEVKTLVKKGIKEIVLTGIHLGAYGFDWNQKSALINLIQELINIKKLKRIRLSSIEVTEVDDTLIKMIADESKLCPHLHLPLQSASEKILKRMKRPYTKAEFESVINKIKNKLPKIALTTDVMVGFPGETENDFQVTFQFIEKIGFSRLHVFSYSKREGTPAAEMKNQIPGNIKKKRSKILRKLNQKLMLDYQKDFRGKIKKVIIEEKRDHETEYLIGFTDNYLRVIIDDHDHYQEQLVPVLLKDSYNYEKIKGEIIKKEGI